MNALKGFGTFLIATILTIAIMVLTSSFIVKEVLQNQFLGAAFRQGVAEGIKSETSKDNTNIDTSKISEAINDDELNKIFNDLLDEYVNSIGEEHYKVSDKVVDEIIDYVINNKDELEKISESKIDIDEIKSDKSKEELKSALNEAFDSTNDFDSNLKLAIKGYKTYTSTKFRVTLFIIILVLIGLLALIKGSAILWMKSTGISLIINGVFATVLYALTKVLVTLVNNSSKVTLNIRPTIVLIIGIVEIVSGIVLMVVCSKLNKKEITTNELGDNNETDITNE